jgi:large subunit ribosomal protein L4
LETKGTGRARAGSSRSPIWRGGGMTHALRPRDYSQKTPKKMVRKALLQSLSDRAAENNIVVVDAWNIEAPKTKDAIKVLEALELRTSNVKEKLPRLLVVVHHTEESTWKSLRGLSDQVQLILPRELNAYDVLCSDKVVFSSDTLAALIRVLKKEHIESYDPMDLSMDDIVEAGLDALEGAK